MAKSSNTVRFYMFHAHDGDEPVEYGDFFYRLRSLTGIEIKLARDYAAVLQEFQQESSSEVALTFVGGDPAENSIYFDRRTRTTEEELGSESRWRGKLTRAVFEWSDDTRILALEGVRNGVTKTLLERYLKKTLKEFYPRLSVELTPLASPSFLDEIEKFERIRIAKVEVKRPNYGFDDMENSLFETARASGAQSASASVKAERGESLSKDDGLVKVIKEVASAKNSSIENASVEGRKPGAKKDERVALDRHQERMEVQVDDSGTHASQSQSIFTQIRNRIKGLSTGRQ